MPCAIFAVCLDGNFTSLFIVNQSLMGLVAIRILQLDIMKKIFISLFLCSLSMAVMAQEEETTERYSVQTNSFWNNWFVQLGAEWNAWYGNVEDEQHYDKSPFKKFRSNPGASIALGKWFTPALGLRTKLQGVWGKAVWTDHNKGNGNKYWILNEQVLFNLSNLFLGYNAARTWSLIPFAGAGVGRSCTYNSYAAGWSVGVLNELKLCDKVALNIEIGWNRYESEVCGMPSDIGTGIMDHPNNVYAEVGITYNIGKTGWKKSPDVEAINAMSQAEIDALNAQLADERAENERLRSELDGASTPQAVEQKDVISTPVSVFFNINEATIASNRDLVNVEAMARYAKENGKKLIVKGYADSATGNSDFNKALSQQRAERIAAELEAMGVSKEAITIEALGGVDTLAPAENNRRATIEIAQ